MNILNRAVFLLIVLIFCSVAFADDIIKIPNPEALRFQAEIGAFNQWDAKNSYPTRAILFAGSSSIRLWRTHDAFPEYAILNRGFGGAHISDVLYYYDQIVPKYEPAVIVFYAGDNDIASDKPVQQVYDDFQTLIGKIRKLKNPVTFIYLPIKPSLSRWSFWDKMNTLNLKIRDQYALDKNFIYVDTATPLLDASTNLPDTTLYMQDQLHLNEDGYKRWESLLAPVLEKAIIKK
jgi:lysophospholipase L1-like esterase